MIYSTTQMLQRELFMFPEGARALIGPLSPMAVYTISPFIGPVVGPLVGGYVLSDHRCVNAMLIYVSHRFVVQVRTLYQDAPVHCLLLPQNTDWRWCYRLLLIWQFVQTVLLFTVSCLLCAFSASLTCHFQCVPETYVPVILKRKARRCVRCLCGPGAVLTPPTSLRKSTGDKKYYAPLEQQEFSLFHMILFSCLTPFSELALALLFFPVLMSVFQS